MSTISTGAVIFTSISSIINEVEFQKDYNRTDKVKK